MGRYRSRSRSYSPRRRIRTPPRGRKRHDDDPRDLYRDSRSHRDRRSPGPTGLLIRNLPLDARPEDLRIPFERYGPVKDVYLPKNYYTGEPRGFGFVKYRYTEDAAEAKQQLSHTVIGGREIRIVYAEENRKTPQEMRKSTRISSSGRYGGSFRRTPPRSPRRRYHSYSRSPSPVRHDSRFKVKKETLKTYGLIKFNDKRDHKSDGLLAYFFQSIYISVIYNLMFSIHIVYILHVHSKSLEYRFCKDCYRSMNRLT